MMNYTHKSIVRLMLHQDHPHISLLGKITIQRKIPTVLSISAGWIQVNSCVRSMPTFVTRELADFKVAPLQVVKKQL